MAKNNLLKKLDEFVMISTNINHINGSLMQHLEGTYFLLKSWGTDENLCLAGLYHALYGTSGFDNHLIDINNRCHAQFILGETIEKIIYTYCACDRDYFWPQIGVVQQPEFHNRFTNKKNFLNAEEMKQFCELTVANELEIARNNTTFVRTYGASLSDLFDRMKPYLSPNANKFKEVILGK